MIKSGRNNVRSETEQMLSVCPLPHIKLNFEIRALKSKFEIDPIKIGEVRIFRCHDT